MFFRKKMEDVLIGLKKVKIKGVLFTIKKIPAEKYLEGFNILFKAYDVNIMKKANERELPVKKIKNFYRDIMLAGVVSPKLSIQDDPSSVCIDEVFNDWDLVERLCGEIIKNTVGKKKIK